jgi:hypothetical protein
MIKNKPAPMTRILFATTLALQVCRYTSIHLTHAGSLWCEAWSTDADLETFRLNGWKFDLL